MKTWRSAQLLVQLRITLAVVVGQTLLTLLLTQVNSKAAIFLWISFASSALRVGMPATLRLNFDLIPAVTEALWPGQLRSLLHKIHGLGQNDS